jgi:two-component system sensor histidine kinase UhpB
MLGQNGRPGQRRRIDDSLDLVAGMTRQIRDIMADLRPPVLDDYGLRAALRWYGPIFTGRTGIGVIILASIPRLPANLEITLFRITQEALNNVLKHAKATEVEIYCALNNKLLSLAIHDNGCGIQQLKNHVSAKVQTWGLLSMRERIESFGGSLLITPRPGGGTIIRVEVRI